jgi:predicted TIM-barrel fold metal-dependent hydrolase
MKMIDVHNHLYPKEWMAYLAGRSSSPTMQRTGPTNFVMYHKGLRLATISVPGHSDWKPRIKDMDAYGIDIQMVSLTAPGVELLPKAEGVAWAKKINDHLAEACRKYKGRFYALAALPYQDVKASVKELERSYKELGVKGITIFSNLAGDPIYLPKYLPIYEAAEAYDLPIFVHPAPPLTTDAMKKARMPLPLYGFILDTTMALTGLIFEGVLEKFPKLKLIHSHLGGVFPYMVGRINDCFYTYQKDFGYSLSQPPSEYYKKNVWVDAISFHLPSMKCCLEYMGVDRLLIGTDYAHPIGGPEKVGQFVRDLKLPKKDVEKIFWKNAAKLFKLKEA